MSSKKIEAERRAALAAGLQDHGDRHVVVEEALRYLRSVEPEQVTVLWQFLDAGLADDSLMAVKVPTARFMVEMFSVVSESGVGALTDIDVIALAYMLRITFPPPEAAELAEAAHKLRAALKTVQGADAAGDDAPTIQ